MGAQIACYGSHDYRHRFGYNASWESVMVAQWYAGTGSCICEDRGTCNHKYTVNRVGILLRPARPSDGGSLDASVCHLGRYPYCVIVFVGPISCGRAANTPYRRLFGCEVVFGDFHRSCFGYCMEADLAVWGHCLDARGHCLRPLWYWENIAAFSRDAL